MSPERLVAAFRFGSVGSGVVAADLEGVHPMTSNNRDVSIQYILGQLNYKKWHSFFHRTEPNR